jgi:hypothetical protein
MSTKKAVLILLPFFLLNAVLAFRLGYILGGPGWHIAGIIYCTDDITCKHEQMHAEDKVSTSQEWRDALRNTYPWYTGNTREAYVLIAEAGVPQELQSFYSEESW